MAITLTPEQIERYSRNILLKPVGGKGQRKLLEARVLIVGMGGLGSPIALYLAAVGIGKLGLVDFDSVEVSNLQRQVIHHNTDVGRPKVLSAADRIKNINPDIKVEPYGVKLDSSNIMDIISGYDIIVDGSDNFPTRYLVNDACHFTRKPLIHGSLFQFEGQATVFLPGKGCYRCLYPSPPPPGTIPTCQEAGILGVLPGIIGLIEATETVKLILGIGNSLAGQLMVFDAMEMEFTKVKLRRNPDCPVCGEHPTITTFINYGEFCGLKPALSAAGASAASSGTH